jgi:hypothetical protein
MEAKWPFMLITFTLIFGLGLTISGLERNSVMNNWSSRRCELPVMAAGMFFKPDSDPRTRNEFAANNFDFCMKTYVDKFMGLLMSPINALFSKQVGIISHSVDMVSTIRQIAATMYNTLLSYLDDYLRKYNASVYEISKIMIYFRAAMRRANAMTMSLFYSGIAMFRGMLSYIQFIMKVILIICGILLAIIIILIFVLFEYIPLILAVLGSVVATVLALVMVMTGEVASEANADKSGFCFSENTKIPVKKGDMYVLTKVKDIKIDDEIENCGKVTAVIHMNGEKVNLYNVQGILVSGSHLILGNDGVWKSVSDDERAIFTDKKSKILYCFNTTSHKITVYSPETKSNMIFRDWEELEDNDTQGQYIWTFTILKILNNFSNYDKWKDSIKPESDLPIMGDKVKIKMKSGFVNISEINMDDIILDRNGKEQRVLGVIKSKINGIDDNGIWNTELYELENLIWKRGMANYNKVEGFAIGKTIITETGEFVIWDEVNQKEKLVRDFTEIGHNEIYKTYPLVGTRLRLFKTPDEII